MRLLYDENHDILDVKFNDSNQNVATSGYELADGIVLYVSENMHVVQLTLVNFRRLVQIPKIHFDRLENQPDHIRKELLSLIISTPLNTLLQIDPHTNYGQIMSPTLLDVCASNLTE